MFGRKRDEKMDFGEAKFIMSRYFNQQLLVIDSVRTPGTCYKFHKARQNKYACASCKKLGKSRSVTVTDGRVSGLKHPEEDHHESCKPVPRHEIDVMEIDRGMRAEVKKIRKRPREAYAEAVSSIPKRFKSTAEQNSVRY